MADLYPGLFQDYGTTERLHKRFGKDLRSLRQQVQARCSHRGQLPRILAYPHYPSGYSAIAHIAEALGFFLTNRIPEAPRIAIVWEYRTRRETPPQMRALAQRPGLKVLNLNNTDITKAQVARWQLEAFGYGHEVDPLATSGPMVEKSDANATHDGKVVQGPLSADALPPGKVYEQLIDNRSSDSWVEDIRVPILGDRIPYVLLKYRKVEERFLRRLEHCELQETGSVLSADEQAAILRFCQAAGLDFADLDVLRDRPSGRLYVVDANNTAFSPPRLAPKAIKREAIRRLTEVFQTHLLDGPYVPYGQRDRGTRAPA